MTSSAGTLRGVTEARPYSSEALSSEHLWRKVSLFTTLSTFAGSELLVFQEGALAWVTRTSCLSTVSIMEECLYSFLSVSLSFFSAKP